MKLKCSDNGAVFPGDRPRLKTRQSTATNLTIVQNNRSCYDSTMNTALKSNFAQLSHADLHALQKGLHCSMYKHLGAHPTTENNTQGWRFAVWAPNAKEVCLITDANQWKHGEFHLTPSDAGIWSAFVPNFKNQQPYKFSIRSNENHILQKADPYAFYAEQSPGNASISYDLNGYEWNDQNWIKSRPETHHFQKPLSIYEVHLGSWKRPHDERKYHNYKELAHMLVEYVQELGYTHLQLLPVTEHPFDGSWGYQTTGYFAPTSRFGTPHDFMYFVNYCHENNIGVLIDWVPAHFPTDAYSIGKFDGTALYEHEDPRKGFHPDWDTYIFNYGRNEVRDFLLSSARFWVDKYHIDGIRVDAVASMLYLDYSRDDGGWIPNEYGGRENLEAIQFLKDMNTALHAEFPGILTIAEESTAWGGVSKPVYDGGLGFSMKWDMGWMNDTLRYMQFDPIHRKHHQNDLSFRMIYAFSENFVLPLSHDEVVHGKKSLLSQMPGDHWQKFANLRMLFAYQYTMPGKKLNFMGSEFGQWHEWNHDEQLDWALLQQPQHDGLIRFTGDLNRVYKNHPAFHQGDFAEDGFSWIQADDYQNSVYAFSRHSLNEKENETIICVFNFTPIPRENYSIGVPKPGFYSELVNSDAEIYGGTNIGNTGGIQSQEISNHGHPQSIQLTLPPLATLILKHKPIENLTQ